MRRRGRFLIAIINADARKDVLEFIGPARPPAVAATVT